VTRRDLLGLMLLKADNKSVESEVARHTLALEVILAILREHREELDEIHRKFIDTNWWRPKEERPT